jgi:hypothetical protein
VTVCEGFFGDESVAAVVLEWVTECGRFGGTLGCVEITSRLNDLSELLVGMSQTDMCLLCLQSCKLGAQVRLSDT